MSIRDDFFANKAVGALWDVAVSIKRGNPLPLDSNSVFASYEALEAYVAGPLAYPGQVVAVVEENSTHIYYLNQDLGIQEVGGVPAVDNASIELNNNILSLHDFGKTFYKFIEESVNEETGETVAGHFEKVAVSEENPWVAGLVPKVVLEDDEYVIGWFESNDKIIENLKNTTNEIKVDVEAIETVLNGENGLIKQVEDIEKVVGVPENTEQGVSASGLFAELNKKADSNSVYTKTETDALIAQAAHLKRKIFNSKEEAQAFVNENLTTAEQYIFMVPSGLQLDSNRYYEYMVINGVLEQVGNWEVNLDDYFTENELKDYLKDYYTSEEVDAILASYATKTDLEGYYTSAQVDQLLTTRYTKEEINTLLNNYVVKEDGKSLVSNTEIAKLATVQANAEPNYIKSVSSEFTVSTAGELNITSIPANKVANLQNLLDNKVDKITSQYEGKEVAWTLLSPENQAKLDALVIGESGVEISGKVNANNVEGLGSWITTYREVTPGLLSTIEQQKLSNIEEGAQVNFIKSVDETQMKVLDGHLTLLKVPTDPLFTSVSNDFTITEDKTLQLSNTLVTETLYKAQVGDLTALNRVSGKEDSTLVDEINYINERLHWQELV